MLHRASRLSTTDLDEDAVPLRIVESEEAEEKRAKEDKEKRESKEKKKEEKEKVMRAKETKLKEEKESEANNRKEKEEKDAKRKKEERKQKVSSARERRVSPRRAPAPMQHLSGERKDRAKHTTSTRDSLTLVELVEEQQQAILRAPRFLAVQPVPPVRKSAKQAARTPSLATKTPLLRPLGLPSEADAPRISKAATALSLNVADQNSA